MFSRKNQAEKTAEEAWEHLQSAWATAGKSAGRAGRKSRKVAGRAGDRVTYVTDEAWARANAAASALAGRRPRRPWGVIVAAGLVGIAAGWVAAGTARAALERQAENEEIELAETAVMVTPAPDER
ncbi:hypothetical protein FHR83_007799 [Actinoplanes campanulatus]|uniref:Uncharacterized protein n=1 Tax=Actinoplanes campanulatus TaxID=113559 RepID=A0A7W5APJ6_9ACTN|nr:hypothetical protein [Actinoplanes campanulatus]MBB3100081.1 hypothetical protein [Actinoplanes campanulatus]GGN29049.1 hypothetical protein GCM10010109_47740 [Actinoplanes campanulatus]GID38950.1 hypothetical protein Aca09nite_54560 [Actinoplanes campanulatus]